MIDSQILAGLSEEHRERVLNMNRVTPFLMMCEAVGSEALPSQIARLEESAKKMFAPEYRFYAHRAAELCGIKLNLERTETDNDGIPL